jgi:hypothetical protein
MLDFLDEAEDSSRYICRNTWVSYELLIYFFYAIIALEMMVLWYASFLFIHYDVSW